MSQPLYRLKHVTKRYGAKLVLDELSFDVPRGGNLVIMGQSGTGKSVTLRLMDGLDKPDSGSIEFDGSEISGLSERQLAPMRHRVAMLFQGGALFDSMTVSENLAFPLRRRTTMDEQAIRDKATKALALVDLEGIEGKMPSALSGGMRKRAALARSLILEPEVMLFDEPTTGLDPVTSETIGNLIRSIQQRFSMTSVVVTHDVSLARRVGDLVAFLDQGRFRFLGTWEQADECPDAAFCRFLAANRESHAA